MRFDSEAPERTRTMSSTTPDDADSQPDEQAVLSHLVRRLLRREGGQVPLERVTLRVSDYVDVGEQAAADLIDEGADAGIYTLERGAGGTTTITGVTPRGPEPDVIVAAFGATADTPDFTIISVVTESIDEALREAGYETFADLANAGVDDLVELTGTLTESRAAAILQETPQHVPVGTRLASAAAQRYARRLDTETDRGVARIVDLATTDITVDEPVYRTDELDPDALEAQYVSAIGRNADDPVATGLHVLDEPDHPDVPKAATHPDAGDDALPVDDAGRAIPPAVPIEPRLQLPPDELCHPRAVPGAGAALHSGRRGRTRHAGRPGQQRLQCPRQRHSQEGRPVRPPDSSERELADAVDTEPRGRLRAYRRRRRAEGRGEERGVGGC